MNLQEPFSDSIHLSQKLRYGHSSLVSHLQSFYHFPNPVFKKLSHLKNGLLDSSGDILGDLHRRRFFFSLDQSIKNHFAALDSQLVRGRSLRKKLKPEFSGRKKKGGSDKVGVHDMMNMTETTHDEVRSYVALSHERVTEWVSE